MNASELIRYGFATGVRQWRPALIVYFVQAAMAFILGMQIFEVMNASIGQSLEVAKLLKDYDHTVWSDFLKVHGASVTPLIGQLRWILPVWLVFSVFLNGGLMSGVAGKQEGSESMRFWLGASRYFFSFLKISVFFWVLLLFWTLLILGPTVMAIMPSLQYFDSERGMLLMVFGMLLLYALGVLWLFLWSLASRCDVIYNETSVSRALKNGWKKLFQHKWSYIALCIAFTGIQVLTVGFYLGLKQWTGNGSLTLIFLYFIFQQSAVIIRIQCRQMLYAGVCAISRAKH